MAVQGAGVVDAVRAKVRRYVAQVDLANAYVDEVKAAVPADKLSVFKSTRAGRHYAFLGVPHPETEFPNLNDRAQIKKAIHGIINGAYITLAGYAAVAALLLYGAYRLLQ